MKFNLPQEMLTPVYLPHYRVYPVLLLSVKGLVQPPNQTEVNYNAQLELLSTVRTAEMIIGTPFPTSKNVTPPE